MRPPKSSRPAPSGFSPKTRSPQVPGGFVSAPVPSWTSDDLCPCRNISRDDAASAHDRMIANRHARENDCSTANPGVAANADRSSELQPDLPLLGIMWMIGRIDLHSRPNCSSFANRDLCHVKDDAVEIDVNMGSEPDVEAVVAVKGGRMTAPSPTSPSRSQRSTCH